MIQELVIDRSRTLSELNNLYSEINDSKLKLRNSLQYYLQKYQELLDIPRLCRALAVPGDIAEQFIAASDTKRIPGRSRESKPNNRPNMLCA